MSGVKNLKGAKKEDLRALQAIWNAPVSEPEFEDKRMLIGENRIKSVRFFILGKLLQAFTRQRNFGRDECLTCTTTMAIQLPSVDTVHGFIYFNQPVSFNI